ncbi:MAG: RDD family protein [Candidatus Dormibacteria bacterium]
MQNPPPAPYEQQPGAQQYGGGMNYASWLMRLVSVIIDGVILMIPYFILSLVVTGMIAAGGQNGAGAAVGLSFVLYLVLIVAFFVYYPWGWSHGGTIGQRILHLRVVDENSGEAIPMGRAFLRFIGYIISAIPCYIGLILAAFDGRKQGWHDKMAHTVVIATQ